MGIDVVERTREDGVDFVVNGLDDRSRVLSFSWGGDAVPRESKSFLPAAAVALLPAALASSQRRVTFHGRLSVELIAALQEWADAWMFIRPDLYSPIQIKATDVAEIETPARVNRQWSAAVAFSGGVDSLFAALTHQAATTHLGRPALVLVHGFDIPLEASEGFEAAFASARTSADVLGMPLSWVRTNWRRDFCKHWTMEFACGVVSALTLWREDADRAVLGSDDGSGYSFDVFPWSSNPATNPLLGSPYFPTQTMGFACTRVDKAALVGSVEPLRGTVRVCWEGGVSSGSNCGRCEKCIRTALCFAAAGFPNVPALRGASLADLPTVQLRDQHVVHQFRNVINYSPQHLTKEELAFLERQLRSQERRLAIRSGLKLLPDPILRTASKLRAYFLS